MWFGVITLFPQMFEALTQYGVTSRAIGAQQVKLECWNPRDFSKDKHRTVDDRPYGGGPGMLMKVQPLKDAIHAAKAGSVLHAHHASVTNAERTIKVIYLSPQGKRVNQALLEETVALHDVILVCGRYEGIDQRVINQEIDEEWSLGDFVLSGGEMAAMSVMDAMIRLVPGVLGHSQSAEQDSFSEGLLDCPHYTRPENLENESVPPVLLCGNHEVIKVWRLKQALGQTWLKRPDLLECKMLTKQEQTLLNEFKLEYAQR